MPKQASNGELRIMAWTKAGVAMLLVMTVLYSVVAGVKLEENVIKLVFLVLSVYFGFSAKLYRDSIRK